MSRGPVNQFRTHLDDLGMQLVDIFGYGANECPESAATRQRSRKGL